jgi:hypothetical protein
MLCKFVVFGVAASADTLCCCCALRHPVGNRHLLAAQGAGNPQAPKKPSAVNRKEWGPNFSAASGDRKL